MLKLSSNDVGSATDASFIEIPSNDRLCGKPENIQVVALGGNYHVTWTEPIGDYDITSYTVFWCTSVSNSSTQCDSPIDFKRVNGTLQFNMKSSDRHLKFAVSANTDSTTSGMTWEQCKAKTDPTQLGRIESSSKIIKISSNEIELKWSPKCEDRLIVKNYKISYCEVENEKNNDCLHPYMSISTNTTQYAFEHLKSSTLYKFTILIKSETSNGLPSVPQYIKTNNSCKYNIGILTDKVVLRTLSSFAFNYKFKTNYNNTDNFSYISFPFYRLGETHHTHHKYSVNYNIDCINCYVFCDQETTNS